MSPSYEKQAKAGHAGPLTSPSKGTLQRKCKKCHKRQLLQHSYSDQSMLIAAPKIVQDVVQSTGQPLDSETCAFFENKFGHDFSKVRVHTDAEAAESARAVNALAYTIGNNVTFNHGQYKPRNTAGRNLLAHELVHTMQQAGSSHSRQSDIRVGESDTPLEQEADSISSGLDSFRPKYQSSSVRRAQYPMIQRQSSEEEDSTEMALEEPSTMEMPEEMTAEKTEEYTQLDKDDSISIFEGEEARLEDIENRVGLISPAPADHNAIVKLNVANGGPSPVGALAYGATIFDRSYITLPKLIIKWKSEEKDKWTATVDATSATLGNFPSLFLQAGTYEIPGKKFKAEYPQCGKNAKMLPFFSQVDDNMAKLVQTGEQEHCSDYERAFEISIKKCADKINAIKGKAFGPDSKAAIERNILNKIGGKTPGQWVQELNRLTPISVDERDKKGWHGLKPNGGPVTCDQNCTRLTGFTEKLPTTQVPGPVSAILIK
jgi:hypothetical protein